VIQPEGNRDSDVRNEAKRNILLSVSLSANWMLDLHTSQNIQRQVDFSVKAPPMTGPVTDPIAHCRLMTENHFPLSLKVTMSVTMT
jgi:hypothetical protein